MASSDHKTIYDFMFYSSSDGVIITDIDLNILSINPAGVAMLGDTLENLINKRASSVFRNNPALMNLFTRSGEQTLDVRLPRRRLAVGIGSTVGENRVVLLQDVTEKRELSNRRESLIRSISHDLRNPIAAITGFLDLVRKSGELNPPQAKFLDKSSQTANRLYEIVHQLVDLAWIEAGMPLEYQPVDLSDMINKAVAQVTPIAQEQKVIIVTSLQSPMPTVMGDPERLVQMVYQLLHNAVIYSPPEQTIVIHCWSDKSDIYCSVADRGIGISDDEIISIFGRLYRSRNEYVSNVAGAGLGLTFAKTIVQRHGGDIWASSNFGEGSTFTFILPSTSNS